MPPPRAAPTAVSLPGEFEPVEELVVGWHSDMEMFFIDLVASAAGHVPITIAVGPEESVVEVEMALADFGLTSSDARAVPIAIDTMWVRDFGPIVVRDEHGERYAMDLTYLGSDHDEAFGRVAAGSLWGLSAHGDDLVMDGGNLLSDGTGRCVTTGFVLDESVMPTPPPDLRERLREVFGCRDVAILPRLFGEETGHVDMYVAIPAPGRALVGYYPPRQDRENGLLLDDAAETLRQHGFSVTRIPMGYNADGVYRTFTNLVALNGVVLVPIYPGFPTGEADALMAIGAAYPDREIVPVIATEPMDLGGALHCATITLPAR